MKVWMVRLAFAVVFLAGAVGLFAQATGSITGTVTDKSGAVIPGATVIVTNTDQNVSHQASTNAQGAYLVGGLIPGTYSVSVTAKGFDRYHATGVALRVGEQIRSDAVLQVGEVTNEVTVTGTGIGQVQTETSSLSGTITGTEVQNLELNGRNFTQLITLVPGVSNQTGQDEGTVGVYGNVNYSVNGGRLEENDWEVDGANVMDNGSNQTINVYPSVDAIGHVRVITNSYSALYGRDAGATVIADTKSGTNQWHGDAYEFLRNNALNARSFFDTTRPVYRKNDYGFTIGGPIKKDKLFVFWSEEWRKEANPSTFNDPVPPMSHRQGNFSDVCPAAGSTPPTGVGDFEKSYPNCPIQSITPPPAGSPSGTQGTYTLFPNDQVPVDPNAADLLTFVPQPNQVTSAGSFFHGSVSTNTDWREELFRVDDQINSKWSAYFRLIHDSWSTVVPQTLWSWSAYPTTPTNFVGPGADMVAHIATTISPTLLNEFVADYTVDHIALTNTANVALPSNWSMPGIFKNGFGNKMPAYMMCGASVDGGCWFVDTGDEPWYNSNPTYDFHDTITQQHGNHALYYGAQFTAAQKNEMGGQEVQPTLEFGTWATCTTNNALADMLTGCIAQAYQSNIQPKYFDRYKVFSPFIQDDWHASNRLTFNLGLRLDMMGTYRDKYPGLTYNFEPSQWVAANAPVIESDGTLGQNTAGTANFYNGLVECAAKGAPASCIKGHLWNFAPRLGFAYDLFGDGKTAFRGGYGVFYDHTSGNEAIDQLRNPPLAVTPNIYNIQGYANVGLPAGSSGLSPFGLGSLPLQETWPYVQQWHMDLQRQFFGNTVITASYVGTKGTHLTAGRNINQLHPIPTAQNPFSPGEPISSNDINGNPICNTFNNGGSVTLPNGNTIASNTQAGNLLSVACGNSADPMRPYLGYSSINLVDQGANSIYHAFQLSARRDFGGLDLNLAYTYSHAIDSSSDYGQTSVLDSYNMSLNRASSDFDQRHMLNFAWVYRLPVLPNNAWLGGWQWSGIMTAQTGVPFTITSGQDAAGVGSGSSFPLVVGNPRANVSSADQSLASAQYGPLMYNPSAFAAPTGLTFGNAGRNFMREPGRFNFDMGLFKTFRINERQHIEFRAEGFNVFNHTQFTGIASGISCFGTDNTAGGTPSGSASCLTSSNFLHPTGSHLGRVIQFGLKWAF